MPRYNPATIESKWQAYWEEHRTFAAPRMPAPGAPKLYALDMFPYPSGDGLHVGHPEGYTATDIVSRAARMQGHSVMHPMGFDSFGLPAEEHAIKTGQHPRIQTEKNIATFRRQLKSLGFSYDWDRELATTDVGYVRWTQWIFLQIYDTWFDHEQQRGRPISELPIPDDVAKQGSDAVLAYQDDHRLAYQSEAPVNWCRALGTVLANEEVVNGKSEVGGHPVVRLPLRQWMLRITAYAERLEKDLEGLDWSEGIKALQRNWIGRSVGAEVDFFTENAHLAPGESPGAKWVDWQAARGLAGFPKKPSDEVLRIYTTRPDTLFGATYMVIAPEHPFVDRLTTPENSEAVKAYCEAAARKSDLDRTELAKDKSGVFTGSYAINPVNGASMPIWVADYVLISYGTGAIMAVPAHDERDFEFAQKVNLPIVPVVDPNEEKFRVEVESQSVKSTRVDRQAVLEGKACYPGDGTAINSGQYNGLPTAEFKKRITADLTVQGLGQQAVNYKLRDWLFSRQRFWGEPFPILHELDANGNKTGRVRAVPEKDLPVDLPPLEDFKPHGRPEPPLDKAPEEWLYPVIDGKRYKRETNTMPQWAGSCWYYLRYLDPENTQAFVDPAVEKAWMPVDLYVGGAEHAVLHLLYSRFWHKVLYDRGVVSTAEPFQKLVNQGMILGEPIYWKHFVVDEAFQKQIRPIHEDQAQKKDIATTAEDIPLDQVQFIDGKPTHNGIRLSSRAEKMSKSRGNVINPDTVVKDFGADSLRLYEMFMGPLEATKPWSMEGVNGVHSFLGRAWRLAVDEKADDLRLNAAITNDEPTSEQQRELHLTIQKITSDIANLSFNTAIARMMEFVNFFTKESRRPRKCIESFVLLLSPFAPHMAEELWQVLGHQESLAYEPWPKLDERWLKQDTVEIVVQINGKVRGKLTVPADADATATEAAARADAKIVELLAGKVAVKTIVLPRKLVNFVVKG
ncbi:MAG: leucine--tRNA ligase [Pirellulales bacterium]